MKPGDLEEVMRCGSLGVLSCKDWMTTLDSGGERCFVKGFAFCLYLFCILVRCDYMGGLRGMSNTAVNPAVKNRVKQVNAIICECIAVRAVPGEMTPMKTIGMSLK